MLTERTILKGDGNDGSEILFPLSPSLLLYTQVGKKVLVNNSRELTMTLNRFIAENAHRYIFASQPMKKISAIVPRVVNSEAYKDEKKAWESWHDNNKDLEKHYQSRTD